MGNVQPGWVEVHRDVAVADNDFFETLSTRTVEPDVAPSLRMTNRVGLGR
jgi:hypothetical protein